MKPLLWLPILSPKEKDFLGGKKKQITSKLNAQFIDKKNKTEGGEMTYPRPIKYLSSIVAQFLIDQDIQRLAKSSFYSEKNVKLTELINRGKQNLLQGKLCSMQHTCQFLNYEKNGSS